MPAPASIKDTLLAARERAARQRTVDLAVPGYEGRLWATFRALDDYSEVRAIVKRHERQPEDVRELYSAADTLIAASVGTYALEAARKEDLEVTLGLPLAALLDLADGCDNDRQAVFAVIPHTLQVMVLFGEYDAWLKGATVEVEAQSQGESGAAS